MMQSQGQLSFNDTFFSKRDANKVGDVQPPNPNPLLLPSLSPDKKYVKYKKPEFLSSITKRPRDYFTNPKQSPDTKYLYRKAILNMDFSGGPPDLNELQSLNSTAITFKKTLGGFGTEAMQKKEFVHKTQDVNNLTMQKQQQSLNLSGEPKEIKDYLKSFVNFEGVVDMINIMNQTDNHLRVKNDNLMILDRSIQPFGHLISQRNQNYHFSKSVNRSKKLQQLNPTARNKDQGLQSTHDFNQRSPQNNSKLGFNQNTESLLRNTSLDRRSNDSVDLKQTQPKTISSVVDIDLRKTRYEKYLSKSLKRGINLKNIQRASVSSKYRKDNKSKLKEEYSVNTSRLRNYNDDLLVIADDVYNPNEFKEKASIKTPITDGSHRFDLSNYGNMYQPIKMQILPKEVLFGKSK